MSLIQCPECSKEISDKVDACPFCGYPFKSLETKENLKQAVQIPVDSSNWNISQLMKNKNALYIVIGVISLILISVIGLNIKGKSDYNDYIDQLDNVRTLMLDGGVEAESLINLTSKVWQNSIYEKSDPKTDKYTRSSSGAFYDDFNIALGNLFSSNEAIRSIGIIEENQILVSELMKELQNPPSDLEKTYEIVLDLYSAYQGLTDFAINPSGSLNTFTENANSKIDKFLEIYKRLEAQTPEKK